MPTSHPYSPDHPITSHKEDKLNRSPFAQRIADTIAERLDPSPLVIGLNGVWGDGKTSTLQLIEERLSTRGDVICVKFNPWYFENEEKLLRGFFSNLSTALGKSLSTRKEAAGEIISKYSWILSFASTTLTLDKDTSIQSNPGEAAKQLGQQLSTVELPALRSRLESILREEGKRIVVFIDDIDRLDRSEIQSIFRLVKLSAGFERTTYLLAFDEAIVSASLGERYAQGGAQAGRDFLDKIIQVPLRLPPADKLSLRDIIFSGINEAIELAGIEDIKDEDIQSFHIAFREGLEPHITTPRKANLFKNTLSFALPILKGEVHPIDQILIEGIRIFLPGLYSAILENESSFLDSSERRSREDAHKKRLLEIINNALPSINEAGREKIRRGLLERIFPQLQSVFGNIFWGDSRQDAWEKEQRICSRQYFHRYFSYAIPSGDVSDRFISNIIKIAGKQPADTISKSMLELGARGADRLIDKLNSVVDELDEVEALNIAEAVAQCGSVLASQNTAHHPLSTASQAGILVYNLLKKSPNGNRRKIAAQKVLRTAEPIIFAVECFRWISHNSETPLEDRILDDAGLSESGKIVAERISNEAKGDKLWIKYPNHTGSLFFFWKTYGNPEEPTLHLREHFKADHKRATEFIQAYMPTAFLIMSGILRKSELNLNAYKSIKSVFDPDELIYFLKMTHGADIDHSSTSRASESPERSAAVQFVRIHKAAATGAEDNDEDADETET
ncbi:NTPase KAP [Corallococcus sp. AB032C]|uniref:KAP family P-loop NTPase fold protein n=1 Tax=Corallococcus TaxID=83461 RepID=UPI000ED3E698|nr:MULTISPECIES: P-loop NTPase fold protein [Corallococcus]NPC46074.1 NTPase KAP [Corallococcus exiguus]RKH82884.1 NTPase KAP [Corallococcus sp. AB032C]